MIHALGTVSNIIVCYLMLGDYCGYYAYCNYYGYLALSKNAYIPIKRAIYPINPELLSWSL